MSRSVTVYDLDPEDLAGLKALSKESNPRQAARRVFKAGLEALAKPKGKPHLGAEALFVPGDGADGPIDFTAEATPGEV